MEQRTSNLAPDRSITAQQIDALLSFLEVFEQPGFDFGKWQSPKGQLPFCELSEWATNFLQALRENGWVSSFDWLAWQHVAAQYVASPGQIASADTETIRKLFTTHAERERFREGSLFAMFENGQIVALLQRLKMIRGEMAGQK
jgi:hypothetical protein